MTRKNASMVEIENNRMFAIYESIMSEGLLGALGGAALGGALGAGAGALSKNIGSETANITKDITKDVVTPTATTNTLPTAKDIVSPGVMSKPDMDRAMSDPSVADYTVPDGYEGYKTTGNGVFEPLTDYNTTNSIEDLTGGDTSDSQTSIEQPKTTTSSTTSTTSIPAKSQRPTPPPESETAIKSTSTASSTTSKPTTSPKGAFDQVMDDAKKIKDLDSAKTFAKNNPIATGAAAGAALGGVVGAFHNDDDRKDESDDDRLF